MSKGWVYILTNQSMPGVVKIGRTARCVNQRASELFTSGVPTPFAVNHSVNSPDCEWLEASMHRKLAQFRVVAEREFFAIEASKAARELIDLHQEQVETWLHDFMPDHGPVDYDHQICTGHLAEIADHLGATVHDVSMAFSYLHPTEMAPALQRWLDRVSEASAEIRERDEAGNHEGLKH